MGNHWKTNRKPWKTMENHSKTMKTIEKHWNTIENNGKQLKPMETF